MRRCLFLAVALFAVLRAPAVELKLNFADVPVDETPTNWHNTVAGGGSPGTWKVLLDDAPSAFPVQPGHEPILTKQPVIAQLARDPTDEHFPMLIYDKEVFDDFTLKTRFKIMGGGMDEMAGLAFRIKDEKNFYVARASALDGTFRFYRVIDGHRDKLIGPSVPIPKKEWQDLSIQCSGNQIHILLNGKEIIPMITDSTFIKGKIGFWTKSDSIAYFTGTTVTYTPREPMAQVVVREMVESYPRVLGIKVYAMKSGPKPQVVASKFPADLNQPGGDAELSAIRDGESFFTKDKEKGTVGLVTPLHDRNGEPIAALRVTLKYLPGQTEENTRLRAHPIIEEFQNRITRMEDLVP